MEYESITGAFTVAYPGTWNIQEEKSNGVTIWSGGADALVSLTFLEGGSTALAGDETENTRYVVTLTADAWGYGWSKFRVLDKGRWQGGVYHGYYCEFNVYRDAVVGEDTPWAGYWVLVNAEPHALLMGLGAIGATTFTTEQWDVSQTMLETVRVY